jgi:hypothetical protein
MPPEDIVSLQVFYFDFLDLLIIGNGMCSSHNFKNNPTNKFDRTQIEIT